MQVINWPELQPLPADLEALRERLQEALPLRSICRFLVERTLRLYPWTGRADLISCYHPSRTYKQGQKVALFIAGAHAQPHAARPGVWLCGQVEAARSVESPIQGHFQVLTLLVHGRQIQMAGGIANASYPEPDVSKYSSADLAWLAEWILETYAVPLQRSVRQLIQKGQIRGRLTGETFLPEQISGISAELLQPIFARISANRPWISLEEIFRGLPDLSSLSRKTILGLLRAALKKSCYRSLGADRWTTPELFSQLNREALQGVRNSPISHTRSRVPTLTKQDEQDLASYSSKFLPAEARTALDELGIGEGPPQPAGSPWRPPQDPVRLPALSYLQITQAYFPVHSMMHLFAPEVQLVFLQFIHGDHLPFLLDRENGLLKAVHPDVLHARILEEDIPAGTHLWLEYHGDERYSIAPRPLPFKRRVPCKLAYLESGQLHIEHSHTSMRYVGNSSLFRADMRFEEFEALFDEASRVNLSVREAMIYAMQEICATDPDRWAHWLDVFNAVFLQRMCPPGPVAFLLYTQPCFESQGGGYFRYKPMPSIVQNPPIRRDRLSHLWDDLLSDPVAPRPVTREKRTVGARAPVARSLTANLERPPYFSQPEPEPEMPVAASSYGIAEENAATATVLSEEEPMEPFLVSSYEPDSLAAPTDDAEPATLAWRDSLDRLLHSLVEPVNTEDADLFVEQANSETEALSDVSLAAAHEESLSFSSPFRWDPKPAWVQPPAQSKPASLEAVDPQRFLYRPKFPSRPFHRQRFYRRFLFYLRSWLSRSFGKTV